MNRRLLIAVILTAIAIAQATRFAMGWPVTIGTVSVPLWASAIAAIVFAALAVLAWRDRR